MAYSVNSGYLYNIKTKAPPPENIGVLMFDGMEPMDYLGPLTVFDTWKEVFSGAPEVFTFSKNGIVTCDYGRKFHSDYKAKDIPRLDAILIPGGRGRSSVIDDNNFSKELYRMAKESRYLLSVCTGTFILNACDLIKNETVTTHKSHIENLRNSTSLNVLEDLTCVADGNVWTSAGVFCGSTMALKFVESFEGYMPSVGIEMVGVHDKIASSLQHSI